MSRRGRRALVAAGVAVLLVGAALVAVVVATPRATATVGDGVAVECAAARTSAACAAWAEEILAAGPGTRTFNVEDVSRLRLERALFGFGDECRAEYFLGRYEGEPVLTEPVPCPAGG